jgi:CelD/BcsL family acetyltransferase involved in cellulose biosynthesis
VIMPVPNPLERPPAQLRSVPPSLEGHRPVPVKSSGLAIRVVRTVEDMEALAGHWRELEAEAVTPVVFQSAAWCRHVVRTAQAAGRTPDLRIYCAYRDGQLVAVWPLKRERSLGLTVLSDLTDPYGQYADAVVSSREDARAVVASLLKAIRDGKDCDALVLRKVRADSSLAPALTDAGARLSGAEQAPAVVLDGATIEGIRAHLSVKRRKNLRNTRNKLARQGEVANTLYTEGAGARAAMARSLTLRQELMDEQGATSRAYRDGLMQPLMEGLGHAASADLDLMIMNLTCGSDDVAIQWGFVHNRRYYAYIAARNAAFDEVSPGTMHLEDVLTTCMAEGVHTVDLLAPAVAYKATWCTSQVAIHDMSLALTARGRLVIDGWQQGLRPLVRRAFLAMPDAIRRPLARALRS